VLRSLWLVAEVSARPFVGRAEELERLSAAHGRACAEHAQVVLVTGEATDRTEAVKVARERGLLA
jgi:hypothetical protein